MTWKSDITLDYSAKCETIIFDHDISWVNGGHLGKLNSPYKMTRKRDITLDYSVKSETIIFDQDISWVNGGHLRFDLSPP